MGYRWPGDVFKSQVLVEAPFYSLGSGLVGGTFFSELMGGTFLLQGAG